MSSFGKYAVVDIVTHNFEKEPTLWWKIRPATSGDELAMAKFMVNARIEVGPDGITREYPPTNTEISHREIALLFAGTNISNEEKSVEDGGEPIIKVGEDVQLIERKIREMPHLMVMEIWDAMGEAIPGWGAMRPKVKKTSGD